MRKNYLFLILFLIGVVSCSEDQIIREDLGSGEENPTLKYGGDKEFDALGHGADITLAYLATEKALVIDNKRIKATEPSRISPNENNRQTYFEVTGSTASSFLKELTSKKKIDTGASFGIFSASFKGSFENQSKETYTNNYSFGEYNLLIQKKEFRYNFGTGEVGFADLRKYLTENFKEDLVRKSNQEIIAIYGTHVYTHVKLGGRLSVRYSSEISTYENEINKKKTVEGGMGIQIPKVFKFNSSGQIINTEHTHLAQKNITQKLMYETMGGDSRYGVQGVINLDRQVAQLDIKGWQSSCTSDNVNLIDFDPGTLIPLWEFVEAGSKRESLKTAIIKYIKDNEFKDIQGPTVYPDRLHSGEQLQLGQSLRSRNGNYTLNLQGDGNLVLCNGAWKPVWATNKYNSDIHVCSLQGDGNLVVYGRSGRAYWASNTHRIGNNALLLLQDDGNLVLCDWTGKVRWTSGTNGK